MVWKKKKKTGPRSGQVPAGSHHNGLDKEQKRSSQNGKERELKSYSGGTVYEGLGTYLSLIIWYAKLTRFLQSPGIRITPYSLGLKCTMADLFLRDERADRFFKTNPYIKVFLGLFCKIFGFIAWEE